MQINKDNGWVITLSDGERDTLCRHVSWCMYRNAESEIKKYRTTMKDSDPQFYVCGFDQFSRFLEEIRDDLKMWKQLESGRQDGRIVPYTVGRTSECLRAQRVWLKEFQEIQDEHDERRRKEYEKKSAEFNCSE